MIYQLKIDKQSLLTTLHKNQISPKYYKVPSPTIMKKLVCKEKVTQDSLNADIIYQIKNN